MPLSTEEGRRRFQTRLRLRFALFTAIFAMVLTGGILLLRPDAATALTGAPPAVILLAAGAIAGAASVLPIIFATRSLADPIRELAEAAQAVTPETISARINVVEQSSAHSAEVARLQNDLNDALARLEEGFQAQEQFVANVAHDLKTPIAILLAQAQTIRVDADDLTTYEHFAASVEEEMRRLGRLVESFLVLKRAEQGQAMARRDPVYVNDVVLDAVQHCTPVAEHYEIRLVPHLYLDDTSERELIMTGDADLLRTMIDNLIRNAIQYSPTDAEVEVTVSASENEVTLHVRDHGPGISEASLATLFDRYQRGSEQRNRAGGTGLGLAIARSVAQLHEGEIGAENQDDGGCQFWVTLPRASEPTPAA